METFDYKHINDVCKFFFGQSPSIDAVHESFVDENGQFTINIIYGDESEDCKCDAIYVTNKNIFSETVAKFDAKIKEERLKASLRFKEVREIAKKNLFHFNIYVLPKVHQFMEQNNVDLTINGISLSYKSSRISDGYSIEDGLKLRVNHGYEPAAKVAQELQNFLNK